MNTLWHIHYESCAKNFVEPLCVHFVVARIEAPLCVTRHTSNSVMLVSPSKTITCLPCLRAYRDLRSADIFWHFPKPVL